VVKQKTGVFKGFETLFEFQSPENLWFSLVVVGLSENKWKRGNDKKSSP